MKKRKKKLLLLLLLLLTRKSECFSYFEIKKANMIDL
jgi:hypothetical protein